MTSPRRPHYPLRYTGEGSVGLRKPLKLLKPLVHAFRAAELPIWMGVEWPKNVALAAEIADAWLREMQLLTNVAGVQRKIDAIVHHGRTLSAVFARGSPLCRTVMLIVAGTVASW